MSEGTGPGLELSISVVSHHQLGMVRHLLQDMAHQLDDRSVEVILTLNVPEVLSLPLTDFPFSLRVIRNAQPKGFGANHNHAFALSSGRFFCVLNPDVRLTSDPFDPLMAHFHDGTIGVAAPALRTQGGRLEESARRFPTPWSILQKALLRHRTMDYSNETGVFHPDWVAGSFMLFTAKGFREVGGFDERYFLYYEDVDLCARFRKLGLKSLMDRRVSVVHEAQRRSHRHWRFLIWHLVSMSRFFLSVARDRWNSRVR
ncbi:MAG: glycosyltransferase [Rhodoferax sp.]|nr:glycosyltransferase [Rhodoferax sp.]